MLSTFFGRAAFAASMLRVAIAQVPSDFGSDFDLQLQVSYTGDASNGFKSGSTFSKDEVAKEPTFALGDSDGIGTLTVFTVAMVDTTDDNARTLSYVRSNFKHSDATKLDSATPALLDYKAPGSDGETGERKFTFLMYVNRGAGRNAIQSLKMPGDGEAFDAKKFQDDNGLDDPTGATAMTVTLDGTGSEAPESSSSSAVQRPSATAAPSSTNAPTAPSSTSAAAAPSSTAAQAAPSSEAAPSSNIAPSSAQSRTAPASTTAAQGTGAVPVPSSSASAEESQAQTPANGSTTALAPTVPTPTTVSLSTVVPSVTASNAPAEQTDSAAGMLSLPWVECAVLAPVVMVAGLLV